MAEDSGFEVPVCKRSKNYSMYGLTDIITKGQICAIGNLEIMELLTKKYSCISLNEQKDLNRKKKKVLKDKIVFLVKNDKDKLTNFIVNWEDLSNKIYLNSF